MNAKELILKKINADANWVDLYVYSLMLGEDLETIGKLMLTPQVTKLVSEYNTNLWLDPFPKDKIKYIRTALSKATDYTAEGQEVSKTISLFARLLHRARGAEEIRILGRLLKINQGIPTDKWGKYNYITGIETFVSDMVGSPFNLLQFISDPEYKQRWINNYEGVKVTFNILDVISSVPHFKEMFNILNVDNEVLNTLSVRNRLESIIIPESPKKGKKHNIQEFKQIRNEIDDFLINSWIKAKNLSFEVPIGQMYFTEGMALRNDTPGFTINLDSKPNIQSFRAYMEDFVIPTLKEKLPNNSFIKLLTFGLKLDPITGVERGFYKPPINMMQVDNTQKTKAIYEQMLHDFNDLNKVSIAELGSQNPVNLFYLYNLIVNKDGFSQSSMTRLFEDLVASGDDKLLVVDYNNWIDKQDPILLADEYFGRDTSEDESVEVQDPITNPSNENVETIGFESEKNTSLDEDYNDRQESTIVSQTTEVSAKPSNPENAIQGNLFYNVEPSTKAQLIDLLQSWNNPNIQIVSNEDLITEDASIRNAKGFIQDGQIFINIDKATDDTVVHEFAHLYLAAAKNTTKAKEYYTILSKVGEAPLWKKMRKNKYYKNKRGSDFDEEVLATMISNYFIVEHADQTDLNQLSTLIKGIYGSQRNFTRELQLVEEVLGLIDPEFKIMLETKTISPFYSDFIHNNYKLSQKLATIKNQLVEDNILKEDCK